MLRMPTDRTNFMSGNKSATQNNFIFLIKVTDSGSYENSTLMARHWLVFGISCLGQPTVELIFCFKKITVTAKNIPTEIFLTN